MTCAVELPSTSENITAGIISEGIDVSVDISSEVKSQISNPIFVSEIDLTLYCLHSTLLQEIHVLSPLERFMSYRCPREALFADADSVSLKTCLQHRGRSRAGKRKGRRSSVRAQDGSVYGASTSNRS